MASDPPDSPRRPFDAFPLRPQNPATTTLPPGTTRPATSGGFASLRTPAAAPPAGPNSPAATTPTPTPTPAPSDPGDGSRFVPREPRSLEEAGLDPGVAEQLLLRYLLGVGSETSRQIATDVCLALPIVKELLEQLKVAKMVQHRGSTAMGDFIYDLTDAGRAKGMEYRRFSTYVGPAPVPFNQYVQSVMEQSLAHTQPGPEDLQRAFADLSVSEEMIARFGPAITAGRALFIHGDPGNGKTSLAERITRCFGDSIWVPHTLLIDGHLVKLYDPAIHEPIDPNFRPLSTTDRLDRRWIKIKRPTVVAGGELTMEMLEIQPNAITHVNESPLQLKANCGTLVIDDFGRQRIPAGELLNRWIFPLERRIDFLRLPDGRKISSPFETMLVFSTNLEPRDLVDEAFLRRIPYKVHVDDPSHDEFRTLVEKLAAKYQVLLPTGSVAYLLERHFRQAGRPLRFCHPRDLLLQVVNLCAYERRPSVASPEAWDRAVANYFGVL